MTAPLPKNLVFVQSSEFRGLAVATIFDLAEKPAPDYLTLDEAFDQSGIEITETSDSESVPELKLENKTDTPVLLLDGVELVGAKQNRVTILTLLVPALATTVIPVSNKRAPTPYLLFVAEQTIVIPLNQGLEAQEDWYHELSTAIDEHFKKHVTSRH